MTDRGPDSAPSGGWVDNASNPDTIPSRTPRRGARRALGGALLAAAGLAAALGLGVAAVVAPWPVVGDAPPGIRVTPQPEGDTRVCAGPLLRFADAEGAVSDRLAPVDGAEIVLDDPAGLATAVQVGSELIDGADATVFVTGPGTSGVISAAQSQPVDADDLAGFTASACVEPGAGGWFVGGATDVGRTAVLSLVNPSEVAATVTIRIFGEDGEVQTAGTSGIEVAPMSRLVLPVAAFAPGLDSVVLRVESRGGPIAAFLQASVQRGLDPGGVDLVSGGAEPAVRQLIPGVVISNQTGVATNLGIEDYEDLLPAVRLFSPGELVSDVVIRVLAEDGTERARLAVELDPARVSDLVFEELDDGVYTVVVESTEPLVAGVRAVTADGVADLEATPLPIPAPHDFAWFAAAPPLLGSEMVAVPEGPGARLVLGSAAESGATVTIDGPDGERIGITLLDERPVVVPLEAGSGYRLSADAPIVAAVTLVGPAELASFPVPPPLEAAQPVVVYPR